MEDSILCRGSRNQTWRIMAVNVPFPVHQHGRQRHCYFLTKKKGNRCISQLVNDKLGTYLIYLFKYNDKLLYLTTLEGEHDGFE